MDPNRPGSNTVLRGASLVSAPFTLVGCIAAAVAVVSTLWIFGSGNGATTAAWWTLVVAAVISLGGFVCARGCLVEIGSGEVRDVVAWRTMHHARQGSIEAVRVRRGPWRVYEMEMDNGTRRAVLGAGPVQFPGHLLPGSQERDLADIDAMLGEVPT